MANYDFAHWQIEKWNLESCDDVIFDDSVSLNAFQNRRKIIQGFIFNHIPLYIWHNQSKSKKLYQSIQKSHFLRSVILK